MVSIIIPVRNAEQLISQCIDSIIKQSIADWELLLIDDGSTDNSLNIMTKYTQQDNRIKVFRQIWSGVSTARNKGLSVAKGKWITFVDADDWISPNYLANMIACCEGTDLVIGGYREHPSQKKYARAKECKNLFVDEIDYSSPITLSIFYYPWAKLYKSDIILQHNLSFSNKIRISEDSFFIMNYLAHCSKLTLTPYTDYFYRCGMGKSKYILDYNDFHLHYTELEHISENFERMKGRAPQYLKENLISNFFYYHKDYLERANYHLFKNNTSKWTKEEWETICVYIHESSIKKDLYKIILLNPSIGFLIMKIITIAKRIMNM